MQWFRLYSEFATDPVMQSLAFEDQRHFVVLLCLKCDGILDRPMSPSNRERIICRGLGLDPVAASEAKRRMHEIGIIDKSWQPVAWNRRQFLSDDATQRTRKYRKSKKGGNVSGAFRERFGNGPDTDTDTDTEDPPMSPPGGGTIREPSWGLPDWIDPDAWAEWEQHRREMRKPMSDLARTKAANQLHGLTPAEQRRVIDTSIQARWTGLFPRGNRDAVHPQARETRSQRAERNGAELRERIALLTGADAP